MLIYLTHMQAVHQCDVSIDGKQASCYTDQYWLSILSLKWDSANCFFGYFKILVFLLTSVVFILPFCNMLLLLEWFWSKFLPCTLFLIFFFVWNFHSTVLVILWLSSFTGGGRPQVPPLCIISGTNGHLSRTTNVQ
jgi:hypothetical protein